MRQVNKQSVLVITVTSLVIVAIIGFLLAALNKPALIFLLLTLPIALSGFQFSRSAYLILLGVLNSLGVIIGVANLSPYPLLWLNGWFLTG